MLLAVASGARAQLPEPRGRARPEQFEDAFRLFDTGRWHEALDAFQTASRAVPEPLPGEAIRRWGVAASEAGRHLAAYIRLRQYLATGPPPVDREGAADRVERAREALLTEAVRFSRLFATAERPDGDSPGERHIVGSPPATPGSPSRG